MEAGAPDITRMKLEAGRYKVKLAETDEEVAAAQRLRYNVFVEEMGADASLEQRELRQEWDRFDPYFDHLILIDLESVSSDPLDRVVAVYRLMRDEAAQQGVGFYCASEYDLGPVMTSGRRSVELGRSCVAKEHRGGVSMHLLWNALARYVIERDIDILFGVASFHGRDPDTIAEALSHLWVRHLAPPDLRVKARREGYVAMDRVPADEIDSSRALRLIPPLLKSYLRLGGFVGEGAFLDETFNTIDVCVVMDTTRMTDRYRNFYQRQSQNSS